jgi:glycosyltransferase involved in cell wall biosynthesis
VKFSALVLTRNEEAHIDACLASLAPAERVVVLDSGSTDRTRERAERSNAARVVVRPFTDFADQRNYALRECFAAGEWVLHVDADERLTPSLTAELLGLAPPPEVVAYNLAPLTFLDGRPIPRASGFPVYQTRLTRAGAFEFSRFGHGQKAPDKLGPLPCLSAAYEHHPFEKGLEEWTERHRGYADREAEELTSRAAIWPGWQRVRQDPIVRRKWLNQALAGNPLRPALVWAYLMFARGGVLDGRAGWEYCRRRRLYERMVRDRVRARPGR